MKSETCLHKIVYRDDGEIMGDVQLCDKQYDNYVLLYVLFRRTCEGYCLNDWFSMP